ncbi:MAG: acetyl-CoA hydrolase/transferase C-terminal domain-containing protein [Sulfuricaulis sp.]|nr:acetyl-CoA hydrolase/transferase C-terminal domain-containing protein [Sulfuricaulis sp.]
MKRLYDVGALLARLGADTTVVLHSGFAEPRWLARQLAEHASAISGAHLLTLMPMGDSPYAEAGPAAQLDVATFFPGRGLRSALNDDRARALRYPLSAIPKLFDSGALRADLVLLQVSSPDEAGQVSLGVSVDYMRAVLAQSPLIVAEINPHMPHTCGDTRLPISLIDWFVDADRPPQELSPAPADQVDEQIARHVAGLVRDGAVLQVGIGSLPDRVLAQLGHLSHLGLHSGIVTDAVRPLIESGVIDNSTKRHLPGVSVTTMAGGSQSFYDFLHRNAAIEFHPCSLTHDASVLASIDGLCAINSALQVDLAAQVNAESVNGRRVSLPGGLPDFAAGAVHAKGGVSIVALRSTYGRDGASNVVSDLGAGKLVTIDSSHVDFVVTEYGVAAVRTASPRQRAAGLIAVAHPRHREALQREFSCAVVTSSA